MKTVSFIVALLTMFTINAFSQDDAKVASPLTISGYGDIYYSYDFNKPYNHQRQPFMYAYNRHNEVNLNIGMLKASYNTHNLRSNLGLMAGTYSNDNMAAEPGVLKNIYEANIGVKLSKTKNIWIDAGVFASHIGFESAIGIDCWTLTRSIMAENSPYFETGAKVTYTTNDNRWMLSGLILNGWQRIQRVDGNNTPAFGHQLVFKPNDRVTLNSSSFIGNDKPDDERKMRYFHDLFGQFQLTDKLDLTAGFDIGWEQKEKSSSSYNRWYTFALLGRYSLSDKINVAARVEYYQDEDGVIISTEAPDGFETWGYSLNFDYLISDAAIWRLEGRLFASQNEVFQKEDGFTDNDVFVTTALAVRF
ncbi:porin [Dysgonomonas sp. GY617]|uniref:porin n=1 Tax=Dysgonomonas sp. GY617 TaxID=2780420 RepID=UPI001883D9D6|nr:porin [Dysgonomonas sp. GY617]MBF0578059.1 porin [Dysgonomonas sp. GY617]